MKNTKKQVIFHGSCKFSKSFFHIFKLTDWSKKWFWKPLFSKKCFSKPLFWKTASISGFANHFLSCLKVVLEITFSKSVFWMSKSGFGNHFFKKWFWKPLFWTFSKSGFQNHFFSTEFQKWFWKPLFNIKVVLKTTFCILSFQKAGIFELFDRPVFNFSLFQTLFIKKCLKKWKIEQYSTKKKDVENLYCFFFYKIFLTKELIHKRMIY